MQQNDDEAERAQRRRTFGKSSASTTLSNDSLIEEQQGLQNCLKIFHDNVSIMTSFQIQLHSFHSCLCVSVYTVTCAYSSETPLVVDFNVYIMFIGLFFSLLARVCLFILENLSEKCMDTDDYRQFGQFIGQPSQDIEKFPNRWFVAGSHHQNLWTACGLSAFGHCPNVIGIGANEK